jgi:Ubiquitin 3 binding protein But2 C-terminal domain
VFLFPEQQDLETSSFTFSGDGKIDFSELSSPATEATTYNNAPSAAEDLGVFTVAPGNSYVISTFACPAGDRIAYELKNAGSTNLTYFEDWNPSPYVLGYSLLPPSL